MKPDAELTQALRRLCGNADFQLFVKHLKTDWTDLRSASVWGVEGENTDVKRGQAQYADVLYKCIVDAKKSK